MTIFDVAKSSERAQMCIRSLWSGESIVIKPGISMALLWNMPKEMSSGRLKLVERLRSSAASNGSGAFSGGVENSLKEFVR